MEMIRGDERAAKRPPPSDRARRPTRCPAGRCYRDRDPLRVLALSAVLLVAAGAGAYAARHASWRPAPELAGTALQNPPPSVGDALLVDPTAGAR
jgi:hypothetical protein